MLLKLNKKQTVFNTQDVLIDSPEIEVLEIMIKHPLTLTLDLTTARNIKKLYLYGSSKDCTIKESKGLEKLEILKLRDFSNIENLYVKENSNLEILQLAKCNLRALPIWCCRFENLQTFELQGNMLEELPIEMEWLKSLKRINLDNNKLGERPKVLENLIKLNHISFDGNR